MSSLKTPVIILLKIYYHTYVAKWMQVRQLIKAHLLKWVDHDLGKVVQSKGSIFFNNNYRTHCYQLAFLLKAKQ